MGSGIDGALYITDSDGDLKLFNVKRNDSGLWLNGNYDNPGNVWNTNNRFVFARPRNSLCFSTFIGGFYFNDLIHPPSILPISFSFSESRIYFLFSKHFISHDI